MFKKIFTLLLICLLPVFSVAQQTCKGAKKAPPKSESEITIIQDLSRLSAKLFKKAKNKAKLKGKELLLTASKSEFLLDTGTKVFNIKEMTKTQILKFIRKDGVKLKLPTIPLDLGLSQKALEEIFGKDTGSKIEFELTYQIEIEPDFQTGKINRNDIITVSPKVSYENMLNSLSYSGAISTSYIFTHTRRHPGRLGNDPKYKDLTSDEKYLEPLIHAIEARPIFF